MKTFKLALSFLATDPGKARTFLNDRRLSQQEKLVLNGYLLLRDNDFKQIFEDLEKLKIEDEFLESQRLLVLGSAHNNKSNLHVAKALLEKSIKLCEKTGVRNRIFYCRYTLLLNAINLKDLKGAHAHGKELELLGAETPKEEICLHSSLLMINLLEENFTEAKAQLNVLKKFRESMNEMQSMNFCLGYFEVSIGLADYRSAYDALDLLKDFRKFRTSSTFKYLRGLLDFVTQEKPLYLYKSDFSDFPILQKQVELLKGLEAQDLSYAKQCWNDLAKNEAGIYGDAFDYKGPLCLFSVALNKLLKRLPTSAPVKISPVDSSSKLEAVQLILQNSKAPIPKELLYAMVYGKEVESKEDLKKLAWLISNLKKKKNLSIIYVRGSYALAS